jgi:hypothetical protein
MRDDELRERQNLYGGMRDDELRERQNSENIPSVPRRPAEDFLKLFVFAILFFFYFAMLPPAVSRSAVSDSLGHKDGTPSVQQECSSGRIVATFLTGHQSR